MLWLLTYSLDDVVIALVTSSPRSLAVHQSLVCDPHGIKCLVGGIGDTTRFTVSALCLSLHPLFLYFLSHRGLSPKVDTMSALARNCGPQMAATYSKITRPAFQHSVRRLATVSPVQTATRNHKIVVIGGGSAGISLSHQLLRKGNFSQDDIAIVDPAQWHHYQPGWTLVGGGLKKKEDLRRPLKDLMDPKFKFYNTSVGSFAPEENYITTGTGEKIAYEQLVVVPGITLDYGSVKGLKEALNEKDAMVSTIYDYEYCDKAYENVKKFKKGDAVFTQPAGVVKCAGAPQKIMWLALDYWKNAGLYPSDINISFATGLPSMFGVPK